MTTITQSPTVNDERTVDPQILRAWGAITIGMLVASFAAIMTRSALNAGMPALMTAAGRLAIAFVLLSPVVLHRYRAELRAMSRFQWLMAVFAGFWMCLHFSFIALSLENTRVVVMQVLVNTSPIIVAVLETVVLRTRLPRVVWVGLIMTILGGGIIGVDGLLAVEPALIAVPDALGFSLFTGNPALGALFAVISAAGAAIYLTTGRKARTGISLIPYIWILTGSGAITGVIILQLTGTPAFGHSAEGYFWVLMMALGPQLVTHSSINYAVAYIPATVVSISAQFVSVSATVFAFLIFTEVPSLPEILGGAIIISGVVVAIVGQSRKQHRR